MSGSILLKTLVDKRWFIFGWALGFVSFVGLMIVFFPAMKGDSFGSLLEETPEALKGLVGDLAAIQQLSTYLATQMFDIRGSILGGTMAIILAIGLTVGEEDRGYFRTLVSLPISRTRLLLSKWVGMLLIFAAISLAELAAIYAFAPTIDETIDGWWAVNLIIGQWLVMAAIGSLVFAVGIGTGKRSLAMLVGVLVVAVSFIVTTFGVSVDWLEHFNPLSIYYYFPTVDVVENGFDVNNIIILMSLILIPTIIAALAFRRRDIAA